MRGMVCSVLRWRGYDYRDDRLGRWDQVTVLGTLASHDQDIPDPLPMDMQVVSWSEERPACAIEARTLHSETTEQRHLVVVPLVLDDRMWLSRDLSNLHRGGGFLMPGDSRMSALLRDLAGTAYDPAVPFHDRFEG